MGRAYKLIANSAADQFHRSRMKVRLYGGGFANGKTTALVAEMLRIARDYPGAAILAARATYPKLNSTLRREFIKWCPPNWIKSFDKTKENTCVLRNGTIIDFRYIEQQGSSTDENGESTSNLLSANYDFIAVDQVDDVQITHEDFLNLVGRLRGATPYAGDDTTMPRTGPRQIILSCNPTLGWPYKKLVKPVHDLRAGVFNPDLICETTREGETVFINGAPVPMIDIFEASTYDNAQNLEPDYIQGLEAMYRGKMRDRYMLGKWVAFDGVVYDEFDENVHVVPHSFLCQHLRTMRLEGYRQTILEGYDFGIASPSTYLLALVDAEGAIYVVDGFYEPNAGIEWQAEQIRKLRLQYYPQEVWMDNATLEVRSDPSIFKRTSAGMKTVGDSVAAMFQAEGIYMVRGNNNILNGILKVKSYLTPQLTMVHPFSGAYGAPKLYVSDKLTWLRDEFATYRWKKQRNDTSIDTPVDGKDHALDALKYMLSKQPNIGKLFVKPRPRLPAAIHRWNEMDRPEIDRRQHRYGA